MKPIFAFLLTLALLVPGSARAQDILLTDMRIHTMDEAGTIERGWVLVTDGKIVDLGAGEPPHTDGAITIDGDGGTLIPGLHDMHVHYWDRGEGIMFLANGITMVRNMGGNLTHAALDEGATSGEVAGPRVISAGPIVDGDEPIRPRSSVRVSNPEHAVATVRSQRQSGYHAIKLYERLDAASYAAAVAEAREQDLDVYGHVPLAMSVSEVLALDLDSIEHLDGFADELAAEGFEPASRLYGESERWANTDPALFAAMAARIAAHPRTHHVPTFAFTFGKLHSRDLDAFFARPEARLLPAWAFRGWRIGAERYMASDYPFLDRELEAKIALVAQMREAGVRFLIGTDTFNPFVIPGYSIHDEFDAFVRAGFSNRRTLEIATREAAAFLGYGERSGTIKPGKSADLVLLDGDPFEDLAVLKQPAGVMIAGLWRDRAEIDRLLDRRAAMIAAERKAIEKREAGGGG